MASILSSLTSPSWGWIWFRVEFICIIVVAIGCGGEVWADRHKFFDKVKTNPTLGRLGEKKLAAEIKEWWKIFFGVVVVMGLAIEALAFSCSFLASNLEIETLRKQNFELGKDIQPRMEKFDRMAFRQAIKGKPSRRVELLYQENDSDSYLLAEAVVGCLQAEGWNTIGPRPLREDDLVLSGTNHNEPLIMRAGVSLSGVAFVTKNPSAPELDDPVSVLVNAFCRARSRGPGVTTSLAFGCSTDPRLPDDLIRFIIGPKYNAW